MENEIKEYERKIEMLEKKVSDLEKRNDSLRECLIKNVQFSTKLSNITYEMDCLLEKRAQEIRDLEKKLEESLFRASKVEFQQSAHAEITDFDIDMSKPELVPELLAKCQPDSEPVTKEKLRINDYVRTLPIKRLEAIQDPNGCFQCPECDHKTTSRNYLQAHYRLHTDEKPFQCKICEKTFLRKEECIIHIRGHEDRFKLECAVCYAKFTNRRSLKYHADKKHNGRGYKKVYEKRRIVKAVKRKLDD